MLEAVYIHEQGLAVLPCTIKKSTQVMIVHPGYSDTCKNLKFT